MRGETRIGGSSRQAARAIVVAVPFAMLLCGLLMAVSAVRLVVRCWHPIPFEDQWDELVSGRTDLWHWLPSRHNEHRILVPRLIFMLDRLFSAENDKLNQTFGLLSQMGLAVLRTLRAGGSMKPGLRFDPVTLGLALTLVYSAVQAENLTWGFQIQFFGVVLGAAAIFATVTSPVRYKMPVLTALMACTAFTLSSGIIACFVAVGLGWYVGAGRGPVIIMALTALALLALYVTGLNVIPLGIGHGSGSIVTLADFGLIYLGSPVGRCLSVIFGIDALWSSRLCGMGAAILCTGLIVLGLTGKHDPSTGFFLAMILFVLIMAGATAYGRASLGLNQALASRYTTPTLMLWLSMILLTCRHLQRRGIARQAMLVASGLAVLTLWSAQPAFVREALAAADYRAIAIPAFLADVADPETMLYLYPDPVAPFGHRQALSERRTSIYSQSWPRWIGDPLSKHVKILDDSACYGTETLLTEVSRPSHGGWRASGTVHVASGAAEIRLALADVGGRIIGYGITTQSVSGEKGTIDTPRDWIGALTTTTPAATKTYALLDSHHACRVAASAAVLPAPQIQLAAIPPKAEVGGTIDAMQIAPSGVAVGWGMEAAVDRPSRLHIDTNLPLRIDSVSSSHRPDVAEALGDAQTKDSGFRLDFSMAPGAAMPSQPRLCLWTEDPNYGIRILSNDAMPDLCDRAKP